VRVPLIPSPSDNTRTGRQQRENGREIEQADRSSVGARRITRLLALAVKFEGLLQQGVVKDYAELARVGQVSRARVSQVMNLLSLAPDIQQQILSWAKGAPDGQNVREASVRALSSEVIWSRQREQWKSWFARPDHAQTEV
jgi:hypothetical protein